MNSKKNIFKFLSKSTLYFQKFLIFFYLIPKIALVTYPFFLYFFSFLIWISSQQKDESIQLQYFSLYYSIFNNTKKYNIVQKYSYPLTHFPSLFFLFFFFCKSVYKINRSNHNIFTLCYNIFSNIKKYCNNVIKFIQKYYNFNYVIMYF